jgi:hypothetical protein
LHPLIVWENPLHDFVLYAYVISIGGRRGACKGVPTFHEELKNKHRQAKVIMKRLLINILIMLAIHNQLPQNFRRGVFRLANGAVIDTT